MDVMSSLHPALSGEFDLAKLLQYPPPQTWRPKTAGEQLRGFVWKATVEKNRNDYSYVILHVLDPQGQLWKLSCAPVTLRKQRESLGIGKGDLVECTFRGTGETEDGRTYRKFKLEKL